MKKLFLFGAIMISINSVKAQLNESFDGETFPPAGWTNIVISTGSGPDGIPGGGWTRETDGLDPVASPHSGEGLARYASFDFKSTSKADLITPAMNFSGGAKGVSFWMYRSATYEALDSLTLYVNTTNSATGATKLATIYRKISVAPIEFEPGWYQYYFDIPLSFNGPTNYIIFRATSDYGLDMYIDDVIVADQPTCRTGSSLVINNYNYLAGTGTATWNAAPTSPVGYQWALNTTGTTPSVGAAVTGTSVSLSGITPNVVNYLFVRTNCGSGDFSDWARYIFAALPCATLVAPVTGTSNVPQNQVFTWTAVPGADGYDLYMGTMPGSEVKVASGPGTSTTLVNLVPGNTYYWFVVPKLGNVPAPGSCTPRSFIVAPESATLANNICGGAITINSSNTELNPVTATTIGATLSLLADPCSGFLGTADDDVWFEFNTSSLPPAGELTITPGAVNGIRDIIAQVYQATSCSNLGTPVTCADATTSANPEIIDLATLLPNTHYFMRVYSYGTTASFGGTFTIAASEGNTLPVTLASFTARRSNSINILNWSTQQELNTAYFVIERSVDGRNFESIGELAAAGNSNTVRHYTFTDSRPAKGNNYYRLRTVDKDNSSALSNIRKIRNDGTADISIYPNPVNDKINIAIDADKASAGHVFITDVSGKMIYSRSVNIPSGNTILPITLNNVTAGSYIMKIQLNNDLIIRKFIKQ